MGTNNYCPSGEADATATLLLLFTNTSRSSVRLSVHSPTLCEMSSGTFPSSHRPTAAMVRG
jgi:hypothetical protein